MTAVAAKIPPSYTHVTALRETGTQQNHGSAKQSAPPRSGKLEKWKNGHNDIRLSPSSCIDNYQALVVAERSLQLLPAESLTGLTPAGCLSVKHSAAQLAVLAKQLEVTTSPISKHKNAQLYLAAGFVVHETSEGTQRAPILLIPVNINRIRGRGSNYALNSVKNSRLLVNPYIAELSNTSIDPYVKPFNDTAELRAYLRSIKGKLYSELKASISANTGLMSIPNGILEEFSTEKAVNIELERTKPGMAFTPMPATPQFFDPQLAIKVLRFTNQSELPEALHNFCGQSTIQDQPVFDVEPDLDTATLEKYYNCAGWMVDIGLGDWQLKNIAALPKRVQKMTSALTALADQPAFKKHLPPELRTVEMLSRLNQCKNTILNAPPEMQHHSISLHSDQDVQVLLQKAKIQASTLEHELAGINSRYCLTKLPSSAALSRLLDTIAQRDTESQLDNPGYFRARRELNEILQTQYSVITENDLAQLRVLAKTLKFAEDFKDEPFYKRCFGSLFKGLDTNWQRLDSIVNFSLSLAQALGSSNIAAQFINQWASFQRDFKEFAPLLNNAAISAHQLSMLLPMFVQQDTLLPDAARTGNKLSARVHLWQRYLHKHYADTNLTPLQLLSDTTLNNHTYPTVTLPQQAIDNRIYQYVVNADVSNATINATALWLLDVTERLQIDVATVRRHLDSEADLALSLSGKY